MQQQQQQQQAVDVLHWHNRHWWQQLRQKWMGTLQE
jgi:hypothetical protein